MDRRAQIDEQKRRRFERAMKARHTTFRAVLMSPGATL